MFNFIKQWLKTYRMKLEDKRRIQTYQKRLKRRSKMLKPLNKWEKMYEEIAKWEWIRHRQQSTKKLEAKNKSNAN
jgi:hypothetical protein